MSDYLEKRKIFYEKYYGSLVGATILKFNGMKEDDPEWGNDPFPSFTIRFADGHIGEIEVSRDEEGNGGGFLFGGIMP
jgi:hypothetical protein